MSSSVKKKFGVVRYVTVCFTYNVSRDGETIPWHKNEREIVITQLDTIQI